MITPLYLLLCSLVAVTAHPLETRADNTAAVNFGNNTGTPKHLASGILYGVPDKANQIPSSFYTGLGVNYLRAGGAQVGAPGRGWIWGMNEYKVYFLLQGDENKADNRTVSHPCCPITRPLDNTTRRLCFSPTTCGVPIRLKTAPHLTRGTMVIGHTTTNISRPYLPI